MSAAFCRSSIVSSAFSFVSTTPSYTSQALSSLEKAKEDLSGLDKWDEESLKQLLLETVQKLGVKNGQVFWPLRSALTGVQFSPGVFESAWILGKEESLNRIDTAINKLK